MSMHGILHHQFHTQYCNTPQGLSFTCTCASCMYMHTCRHDYLSLSYKKGHKSNLYKLQKAFSVAPLEGGPALWGELSHCLLFVLTTASEKGGEGERRCKLIVPLLINAHCAFLVCTDITMVTPAICL